MNRLNVTQEAIASNENLTQPLKENFMELITIFHQVFEQVNLDNFNERIKGLRIKRGSKYLLKSDLEYRPLENVLYINEERLMKVDAKHSLMMMTLQMITAKKSYYGMNDNGKLEGLNLGFTEMIANTLVGNEEEMKNYDEYVMVNLAVEIAGIENTLNAYFANIGTAFTIPFIKNSKDMDRATKLLDEIQYNYEMRHKLGKSRLGENIETFINVQANNENINNLERNVMLYPGAEELDYSSLDKAQQAFTNYKLDKLDKTI